MKRGFPVVCRMPGHARLVRSAYSGFPGPMMADVHFSLQLTGPRWSEAADQPNLSLPFHKDAETQIPCGIIHTQREDFLATQLRS